MQETRQVIPGSLIELAGVLAECGVQRVTVAVGDAAAVEFRARMTDLPGELALGLRGAGDGARVEMVVDAGGDGELVRISVMRDELVWSAAPGLMDAALRVVRAGWSVG